MFEFRDAYPFNIEQCEKRKKQNKEKSKANEKRYRHTIKMFIWDLFPTFDFKISQI